jgi:glycosyltransferase involved in cell wall biosynthesis
MNAVVVDGDVCYPATSGKRLRTLHLMLRLARRHRIAYVCRCPAGGAEAAQATAFLRGHGIETLLIDHPLPRKSGPLFHARLAANLLSPLPYSVTSHDSPLVRQTLRAYAARHRVDLWQFEWPAYAEALGSGGNAPRLLVAHNVESLIWQRYHETELRPLRRWYIGRQWHKYRRFERRLYAGATRVVAVSPDDAALLRDDFGVPDVAVVENGVDTRYFAAAQGRREPDRILFLGALDYRPNIDAVGQMLERVFPAVRAQEPSARLCVVGRNPSPALARRARALPGVALHADVPDVRPFLGQCGVMAVPLRVSGGSRLKILEALASGLPVVSTRVGAEGLGLTPDRHLTVVEGVEDMAAALVGAVRTPARHLEMAERGRHLVRSRCDWGALADKLEQVWEECQVMRGVGRAWRVPEGGVLRP